VTLNFENPYHSSTLKLWFVLWAVAQTVTNRDEVAFSYSFFNLNRFDLEIQNYETKMLEISVAIPM